MTTAVGVSICLSLDRYVRVQADGVGRERYSIGEFSQRSWLTPRALRLYDEAGLLSPDFVDDATGYRYYADAQLDRAFLIAALRSAGVPLSTVAAIVDHDTADAHVLVDRWWGGVRAEHLASAAALRAYPPPSRR